MLRSCISTCTTSRPTAACRAWRCWRKATSRIHSWPEDGYAALDVFMCGDAKPHATVDVLKAAFRPNEVGGQGASARRHDERAHVGDRAPTTKAPSARDQGATGGLDPPAYRTASARAFRVRALVSFGCAGPWCRQRDVERSAMARWVEETFHPHWRVRLEADRVLHEIKTEHQHLVIFENADLGHRADARRRVPAHHLGRVHLPRDDGARAADGAAAAARACWWSAAATAACCARC